MKRKFMLLLTVATISLMPYQTASAKIDLNKLNPFKKKVETEAVTEKALETEAAKETEAITEKALETEAKGEKTPETEAAKETVFDTGAFKVTVPVGWKGFLVEDDDTQKADPDAANIYKGAAAEADMSGTAGIMVQRVDLGKYTAVDTKALYKSVKEIEFEAGGKKWTGFTGKFNKIQSIVLECDDKASESHWSVTGTTAAYSSSFDYTDADFQKMLGSLTYTAAKKETEKQTEKKTEKQTEKQTKKHEHNYELVDTVKSTCVSNGYMQYKCAGCGDSYEEDLPLTDHNFSCIQSITAKCESEGYDVYECSGCGYIEQRNYEEALGHNYQYSHTEAATCYSAGYDWYACSRCGEGESRNYVTPGGHNYEYSYTKYATCTENGYEVWRCSGCGDEELQNVTYASGAHSYYYYYIDTLYHGIGCLNCSYFDSGIHYFDDGPYCGGCGYSGPVG